MQIDFAQHLRTLDGETIRDDHGYPAYAKRLAELCHEHDCDELKAESLIKTTQPELYGRRLLTVGSCAVNALLAPDERASGAEKMERWLLAERIHKGGVQEVTVEEVVLLKDRVGKCYHAVAVGPVYRLLESPAGVESEDSGEPPEEAPAGGGCEGKPGNA